MPKDTGQSWPTAGQQLPHDVGGLELVWGSSLRVGKTRPETGWNWPVRAVKVSATMR